MKEMFYTIASSITEWFTGCNGTGKGIEGIANVIRYINVLEDVKLFLNIVTLIAIGSIVIGIVMVAWEFISKRLSDGFVSIEVKAEN